MKNAKQGFKKFFLPPNGRMPRSAEYLYLLAGLVFVVGIILLLWFAATSLFHHRGQNDLSDTGSTASTTLAAPCQYHRVLDGVCVDDEDAVNPKLIGVMVENHVDSRPQSGLAGAAVVYEAPVEANITRFLALFPVGAVVDKVGPVRSARPYYLDWMAEYGDALYMHVGGSPDALEKIDDLNLFDVNEMQRGWYFWRSDDRNAPHNVYTDNKLWDKALADYKDSYQKKTYDAWTFTDGSPCHGDCITEIIVSFAPPAYRADWRFVSSTDQYERYQMGVPHLMQDGKKIVADTVIVQKVHVTVLDAVGRREIDTIGKGQAIIFRDGQMTNASWKKSDRTSRTHWLDADGNDIPLKPGKIWIEVAGQDDDVSYQHGLL